MSAAMAPRSVLGAAVLAIIFLAILVVVFALVYLLLPDHYEALVIMGVLALILGLCAYLAQSFSRDATVQRALGWGFGAMGFALLFGAIWVNPQNSLTTQLEGTLPVLIVLIVAVALTFWRVRTVRQTSAREERRADWAHSNPPSAFDYAAARAPGTTPGGAPASRDPPGPRTP